MEVLKQEWELFTYGGMLCVPEKNILWFHSPLE